MKVRHRVAVYLVIDLDRSGDAIESKPGSLHIQHQVWHDIDFQIMKMIGVDIAQHMTFTEQTSLRIRVAFQPGIGEFFDQDRWIDSRYILTNRSS